MTANYLVRALNEFVSLTCSMRCDYVSSDVNRTTRSSQQKGHTLTKAKSFDKTQNALSSQRKDQSK
jgi:hypothetical protein